MKKWSSRQYRILFSMLIFLGVLIVVGVFMQQRMRQLLYHYMEQQVTSQAGEAAELLKERFDMEIESMERLAFDLGKKSEDLSADLMDFETYLFADEGEALKAGILALDGTPLYGDALVFSEFFGIQDSFRGNASVSYCEGKGLLFTVPIFHGNNVKYVFYHLYEEIYLQEKFLVQCFNGQVDIATIDVNEKEIISFQRHEIGTLVGEGKSQEAYKKLQDMLNVSSTAATHYKDEAGESFMFLCDVTGYEMFFMGVVPEEVMSKGISDLIKLVLWVFALLILLMIIGIAYVINAEARAQESDNLRMEKLIAENASRQKSDFLANMSHEIRTPINAIMGMNEMVLRECRDDNIKGYANNIANASQILLSLVNDVLDLSKIESGKMEILPEPYQIASLISDVVNLIQVKASQKDLAFLIEVDKDLPTVLKGDEVRIRQVMLNLLNNAIKYTNEGSVLLKVYRTVNEADEMLLNIEVTDTGIGIKEEDMGKLFGDFERLDLQKNRNIEGTGLGLAITKKLANAMGGDVQVKSEYTKGSTFSAVLPQTVVDETPIGEFKASVSSGKEEAAYRTKFIAPSAKVLAVDDNELNLLVVKGLLKETQLQITTAASGEECLERIQKETYDLIFLDHMMPGLDGVEVMKHMKTMESNLCANTPVIALTANAIKGIRETYLQAGFSDYLTKPIEDGELERMVAKYLPEELVEYISDDDVNAEAKDNTEDGAKDEAKDDVKGNINEDDAKDAKTDNVLLDREKALHYCSGDEGMLREILDVYCAVEEENVADLNKFLEEKNWRQYKVLIHSVKSNSKTVGSQILFDKALELEMASKDEDEAFVKEHHEECIRLYHQVVEEARAYLNDIT